MLITAATPKMIPRAVSIDLSLLERIDSRAMRMSCPYLLNMLFHVCLPQNPVFLLLVGSSYPLHPDGGIAAAASRSALHLAGASGPALLAHGFTLLGGQILHELTHLLRGHASGHHTLRPVAVLLTLGFLLGRLLLSLRDDCNQIITLEL